MNRFPFILSTGIIGTFVKLIKSVYSANPLYLLFFMLMNKNENLLSVITISLEHILLALAGGVSEQELLEDYPELEPEDFQVVFMYTASLVTQEKVLPIEIAA